MRNVTDISTFTDPVTVLQDSDPVNDASTTPTVQALSNRSRYLKNAVDTINSTIAAPLVEFHKVSLKNWYMGNNAVDTFKNNIVNTRGVFGGGKFAIVTAAGISYSSDGKAWSLAALPGIAAPSDGNQIAWNGSLYVAIAGDGSTVDKIFSSPDAVTWTARQTLVSVAGGALLLCVFWDSVNSVWLAGSINEIWTSPNGTAWISRAANFTAGKYVADFAVNPSGVQVAVGESGKISSSSDGGVTWVARTSNVTGRMYRVIWDATIGLFIGTSQGGSGPFVTTSPDGITWTAQTTPFIGNSAIMIATNGAGMVVAGDLNTGHSNACMLAWTTNGITWTRCYIDGNPTGDVVTIGSIVWTGKAFVAAAQNGKIYVSFDGKNFTGVTADPTLGSLSCLMYDSANNFFVVNKSNSNLTAMTAPPT